MAFQIGDNFIVVKGRIFYPTPSQKTPSCLDCDFRHDFGQLDCSCICDILNVPQGYSLTEVFSHAEVILHS